MKFIVILICLGLERYFHLGEKIMRSHCGQCFGRYLKLLASWVQSENAWRSWTGLAVTILPAIVTVTLLYWLLCSVAYGLVAMLLSVAVLLYSLGPADLYHQVNNYFAANENKDKEQAATLLTEILGDKPPQTEAKAQRALTETILGQANERLFAVVLWFALLGPAGALLYRMATLSKQNASSEDGILKNCQNEANLLVDVLNWLPARVMGIVYFLAGNFSTGFSCWIKHAWMGFKANHILLVECPMLALGLKTDKAAGASLDDSHAALDLVDRSLIIVLFLFALFMLGVWLF